MTQCFSQASGRLRSLVREQLAGLAEAIAPKRIVIKPNWVLHQTDPAFPIKASVTDPRLIEAVAEACLELFPQAQTILVGDCPLQYADFPRLCRQSGLELIRSRLEQSGKITVRDLRQSAFQRSNGTFLKSASGDFGDPRGYREIELGGRSHLEPLSAQWRRFAVNDYSAEVTSTNHRPGSHRYLVSQSILDCDLFINLPKWKTHQKSGLTAALKNLVGINGDKAYLPHFRKGAPKWGGDEYRDDHRWLYFAQTRLRERFQKRNQLAYQTLKAGWELIKKIRRIETRCENPSSGGKRFYIAGGAWHGNQTIWRMIYDLNLVIRFANAEGQLEPTPQRAYFCIVDGLVCGEGNGPLQALPRAVDWLVCGDDPFAIDTALAFFMGFDPEKIPLLAQHRDFPGPGWGQFEPTKLEVQLDGRQLRPSDSGINFHFLPPPGWRNYVER